VRCCHRVLIEPRSFGCALPKWTYHSYFHIELSGYGPCIACRPHSDRLVADHCAVGPELLRSIQEVGFVQRLPHFRMQRSFV